MNENLADKLLHELRIKITKEAEELLEKYKRNAEEYSQKLFRLLLSADLSRIIEGGSLPSDLLSTHKVSLKGTHLLQLLEAEDVSKAKSSGRFYFRAKIESPKDVSVGSTSKTRMMKLILTDGKSVCPAMEYRYLPELDAFIDFWNDFVEKLRKSDQKGPQFVHILAVLSGEPEVRRGVIMLLPGMLTFIKHADFDRPFGEKLEKNGVEDLKEDHGGSKVYLGPDKPNKRVVRGVEGMLDIRSYSNFIKISNEEFPTETGEEKRSQKSSRSQKPSLSSLNGEYGVESMRQLEEGFSQKSCREGIEDTLDNFQSHEDSDSSVVELKSESFCPSDSGMVDANIIQGIQQLDYLDFTDVYADVEIREDLEYPEEQIGELEISVPETFPGKPDQSCLEGDGRRDPEEDVVIWVEAAVLDSRRSNNDDEVVLELGVHYPVPLPTPWDNLLKEGVFLSRQVAERILSFENKADGRKTKEKSGSGLSTGQLVLYVRFVQGNMCLNALQDPNSTGLKKVHLIGFVPA
ncbi:RecQ mediated genome instability protein [Cryptosporidium felis]|nr:RecQ mediated genome instability protein [Cryptosporidium felis]